MRRRKKNYMSNKNEGFSQWERFKLRLLRGTASLLADHQARMKLCNGKCRNNLGSVWQWNSSQGGYYWDREEIGTVVPARNEDTQTCTRTGKLNCCRIHWITKCFHTKRRKVKVYIWVGKKKRFRLCHFLKQGKHEVIKERRKQPDICIQVNCKGRSGTIWASSQY